MNAKQIAQVIANTCRDLHSLRLVFAHNSPCVVDSGGGEQVCWPTKGSSSATAYPFGSLEQYLAWVREGEFTCLLFDYSLIRASYECMGNTVVGHSLLYWPCPIGFLSEVETLSDLCDGLEMCLESPRRAREILDLTMRTPMRFDFDPGRESDDHPLVHLHTQFEDTRMSVQQAMCFPAFMKKVLRTFYRDQWTAHPDIEAIHEQAIEHEDAQCDPLAHCLQVSWS
ncbi:MAG: DUF2290 domain-containing protein [Phycisphaerae bacterium]|nr:DUF2290 domain-containing protein [Phycisphaerae bacterium]